jgi:hypothetical protein
MKSAGHRMGSMKELDTYIRDPRGISGHVQVLVIFLADNDPYAAVVGVCDSSCQQSS